MSFSKDLIPSALAVARAGAELGWRWRSRASSVLETVMAAVPARPATSPLPMLLASFSAILICLPPSRALGLGPRWLREAGPRRRDTATARGAPYAAFGPAPAACRQGLSLTERVS